MRLVHDLDGLGAQLVLIDVPVMATEHQIGTAGKHDSHICLGAAAIAPVMS